MADLDFRVKNGLVVGSNNAIFGTALTIAANGNIYANGTLNLPEGTVSSPSLTIGDPGFNTGFFGNNDNIVLSIGGFARITSDINNTTFNSGSILAPARAAANPSYSFATDKDIGMYRVGTDTLGFATNGTLRFQTNNTVFSTIANTVSFGTAFTVTPTGNVGISNTTPIHKFRVDGDISLSGGIHANGSLGATGHVLHSNGTVSYWDAPAATGVTSVASGSGLTGGPITDTGS